VTLSFNIHVIQSAAFLVLCWVSLGWMS